MNFDIDSGKLLYVLGIVFAAGAFVLFARDVVFDLSITVKAALLFGAFVAFFVAGLTAERGALDVVAFSLSGLSYVVFVGYVVLRYGPGETGAFLLLALSAALFVALGFLLREGDVSLPRRTATGVIVGLVLVSGVLVGVDALGSGVTYDLATEESVTVGAPADQRERYVERRQRVGTLTVTNEFVFTRAMDLPEVEGCVVGTTDAPRRDVWLTYEDRDRARDTTIAGGQTRQFPVVARLPVDANRTEPMTFAVERGRDCTVDRPTPALVVHVGEGDLRF